MKEYETKCKTQTQCRHLCLWSNQCSWQCKSLSLLLHRARLHGLPSFFLCVSHTYLRHKRRSSQVCTTCKHLPPTAHRRITLPQPLHLFTEYPPQSALEGVVRSVIIIGDGVGMQGALLNTSLVALWTSARAHQKSFCLSLKLTGWKKSSTLNPEKDKENAKLCMHKTQSILDVVSSKDIM